MNINYRFFLIVCIVCASMFMVRHLKSTTLGFREVLLTPENKAAPALRHVMKIFNLDADVDLSSIVEQTQKAWLRPAGVERFQLASDRFAEYKNQVMPLFRTLLLVDECKPTKCAYDYAVVLGATVGRVRDRLQYLSTLFDQGFTCKNIVFLTGQRDLDPVVESEAVLLDRRYIRQDWQQKGALPTTETGMMQLVYDHASSCQYA